MVLQDKQSPVPPKVCCPVPLPLSQSHPKYNNERNTEKYRVYSPKPRPLQAINHGVCVIDRRTQTEQERERPNAGLLVEEESANP